MRRHSLHLVVQIAAIVLMTSCALPPPTLQPTLSPNTSPRSVEYAPLPTPAEPVRLQHSEGHLAFGINLLRQLAAQKPNENVFISPPNIALALGMAANGAGGETLAEMLRVLGGEAATLDQLNADYLALRSLLSRDQAGLLLDSAASVWLRRGFTPKSSYLERVQQVFGARAEALDFNDPAALGAINRWVSERTRGRIPQVVDQVPAEVVMLLVAAIYFKGDWQTPFDEKATQDQPFTLASGAQVQVPLMFQSGKFAHVRGEGFQAVRLPYVGGDMWMTVLVPDEGRALSELINALDAAQWQSWSQQFVRREGDVFLPRFRLRYRAGLNEALVALGIERAFAPERADFRNMADEPLFINAVRHEAFLEVNEQGSEAAAATTVEMGITAFMPETERFVLRADRPFLVVIEDRRVNVPLFLGAVFDPTRESI